MSDPELKVDRDAAAGVTGLGEDKAGNGFDQLSLVSCCFITSSFCPPLNIDKLGDVSKPVPSAVSFWGVKLPKVDSDAAVKTEF